MPGPVQAPRFAGYLRAVAIIGGGQLAVAVLLSVLTALAEGAGLMMLAPLLVTAGVPGNGGMP